MTLVAHCTRVLVVTCCAIIERDMLAAAHGVTGVGCAWVIVETEVDDPIGALTIHAVCTARARVAVIAGAQVLQGLGDAKPPDAPCAFTGDRGGLLTLRV